LQALDRLVGAADLDDVDEQSVLQPKIGRLVEKADGHRVVAAADRPDLVRGCLHGQDQGGGERKSGTEREPRRKAGDAVRAQPPQASTGKGVHVNPFGGALGAPSTARR
jgi:hypothetical protein